MQTILAIAIAAQSVPSYQAGSYCKHSCARACDACILAARLDAHMQAGKPYVAAYHAARASMPNNR